MNYQFATSINQLLKKKKITNPFTLLISYSNICIMIHYDSLLLNTKLYLIIQNKITPHDVSLSVPFSAFRK